MLDTVAQHLAAIDASLAAIFSRLADPMHPLLKAGTRLLLASALLARNEMVLGRSFKYHRPRGIMSAGVEESGDNKRNR